MNNILHMSAPVVAKTSTPVLPLLGKNEVACEILQNGGQANIVIVCEHASNYIPQYFNGLGLGENVQSSHIAWDPGAKNLAIAISSAFDAPLVCSKISRLVYDCNRPIDAPSAMPSHSEIFDVPGNVDVSPDEVQARIEKIYNPFTRMLSGVIGAKNKPAIVTIHSFTPIYHGEKRDVEIGILHGDDSRLADAMLSHAPQFGGFAIERNQPYGPADGVDHTIKMHGQNNGLLNVMIEVRNDLLVDSAGVARAANTLASMIKLALADLAPPHSEGA